MDDATWLSFNLFENDSRYHLRFYGRIKALMLEAFIRMPLKTSDLTKNDCVRLVSFGETDPMYRRRLFSFGIKPGVCARVVRRAPLGCPIQLDVRGTALMLRAGEASELSWEYV
jgi:ferrous iron transport protein A